MIERLILLSIRRRRLVFAAVAAAAIAALWQARHLRLDALPDVTGNQVVILTEAPGYTPEEVERLVTRPVELTLGGVPGLQTQRSVSRYGLSSVTAVFEDHVDLLSARQLTQERLSTIDELPAGVGAPELGPLTGGLGEILQFTVRSPLRTPTELLELVELQVAPILRTAPGVVEVNSWGGHRRTLDAIGDPIAMSARGIDLDQLRDAVERASGNAPGDALSAGAGRVLVRSRSWPESAAELGAGIAARDEHGALVRIADVADVRPGAMPRLGAATADGRGEVVYVMVQMLREANALEVLDGLERRMVDARRALPDDVVIDMVYNRGELVRATLETVATNLAEGGLLVIAVLFLMLGSARAGFIVAAVIPLSMLGALVGMVVLDVPGNLMSLGAIDFGLLVDGAVVLIEAVFHRFEAHEGEPVELVSTAVVSMARPVFFSVAIIVLVYVPILTLTGVDGKLFRPMAVTVVLALVSALVLTMTFVPAAAALLRPRHLPRRTPVLVRTAVRLHAPALAAAARYPRLVALTAVCSLGIGALLFSRAGTSFVPQLDEGDLVIQTTRAANVALDTAVSEAARLERALLASPEIVSVASRIGSPAVATDVMGLEQADVFARLAPRSEWRPGLTRDDLIDELTERIAKEAPGSAPAFTQPIQMRFNELLGGDVSDVSLSFFGNDLTALRDTAEQAAELLGDLPGAEDVRLASPPSVPLYDVRPDPVRAARFGLDPASVMQGVRALRIGVEAGATYDGLLRIPLRVRLPEPAAFDLDAAMLPTSNGPVPLAAVADIEASKTPALISHDDAQRRVVLGFNVRGRDLGTVVRQAQARIDTLAVPEGIRLEWGGQWQTLQQAQARLATVLPMVLGGILMLLLFLFRTWRPAVIILLHVPFAALGGVALLSARGMPVSISAAIGFIALSGIAVLNGVVLVARIRDMQDRGYSPRNAALEAGRSRLRPVLTTALVAALGFVPMMLASGVGAEVQRPLATVVVGGLVTSTVLTLLVLPVVYPLLAGRPSRAPADHDEDFASR